MVNNVKHLDAGSLLVIFITGFTHDLLLEAGVFLVSVKLIIMSYKNSVTSDKLLDELSEIRSLLQKLKNSSDE